MPIQTSQVVVVPREPWRHLARMEDSMGQRGLFPEGAFRAKNVDFGDRLSHEARQDIKRHTAGSTDDQKPIRPRGIRTPVEPRDECSYPSRRGPPLGRADK